MIELIKINNGFLLCTGSLKIFTFFLSTNFTIDQNELKLKPELGKNDKSNKHLGEKKFDQEIYNKYLSHEHIDNLKGLKIEMIYKWKLGETLIMDRSHIHSSSSRINEKKLGLTTFTKK